MEISLCFLFDEFLLLANSIIKSLIKFSVLSLLLALNYSTSLFTVSVSSPFTIVGICFVFLVHHFLTRTSVAVDTHSGVSKVVPRS